MRIRIPTEPGTIANTAISRYWVDFPFSSMIKVPRGSGGGSHEKSGRSTPSTSYFFSALSDPFSLAAVLSSSFEGPQQVSPEPQHPPVLLRDSRIAENSPFFFFFSFSIFNHLLSFLIMDANLRSDRFSMLRIFKHFLNL